MRIYDIEPIQKIDDEVIKAAGDIFKASFLFNRGYNTKEKIEEFYKIEGMDYSDPFEFDGMAAAVKVVDEYIKERRKITVYGDYDVDGVTSTTLLVEALRERGAVVGYHVPDRFAEGYGMDMERIRTLKKEGTELIITCDCGISNVEEINLAKELGMKVIVTDHHSLPEKLPNADIILNPKLLPKVHKAYYISGCVMAYYFVCALIGKEKAEEHYLDLAVLSIIADVVPLNNDNRILFKKGRELINNPVRTGIKALKGLYKGGGNIEEQIGFQIAPRINAAGRLDSAKRPVELLLETDLSNGVEKAVEIDLLNRERKRIQEEIISNAVSLSDKKRDKKIIVLYNPNWHHGVTGIAAGRICEITGKPVILLSLKHDGESVTGSARSVEGVNIVELIRKCSKQLISFGGHAEAAGLKMDKNVVDLFIKNIENEAEKVDISNKHTIKVDMELSFDKIDDDFLVKMSDLSPFGERFEPPIFSAKEVKVTAERIIKEKHHILTIQNRNINVNAVMWNLEDIELAEKTLDIIYKINLENVETREFKIEIIDFEEREEVKEDKKRESCEIVKGKSEITTDKYFYYEGLEKLDILTFDRYTLEQMKEVVMLSIPPSKKRFQEMIKIIKPSKIWIDLSKKREFTAIDYLKEVLKIIKSVIEKGMGIITLAKFAKLMNTEEITLLNALDYLNESGKIKYTLEFLEINVEKGDGKSKNTLKMYEKRFMERFEEEAAFKRYFERAGVEEIKEYL